MPNLDYACACGEKTQEEVTAAKSAFCPKCDTQYVVRHNTKHYERKS